MRARRPRWPIAALIGLALLVRPVLPDARADEGVVLLVNVANPVTTLGPVELRRAFTGGIKQWSHGAVVQVGLSGTDTPELRFVASRLDMTPRELVSRVQEQVFKGEMRRPLMLRSSGECVGLARSNPGALCAAVRPASLPPEVKAVTLRGER